MKPYIEIGTGIYVHENVKIGKNVTIGHGSCIGFGDPEDGKIIIGDNVTIGAFCVIHFGAVIKNSVTIDHNCIIGIEAEIGKNAKILSGKEIAYKSQIGEDCVIGGNVADRTIIEDKVTFMGEIVHSHRNASLDWETTEEKSPIIKKGSVIGVNALLIGGIEIGPCAYVGAGEIVRTNVGKDMAFMKAQSKPLTEYRDMFKTRCNE